MLRRLLHTGLCLATLAALWLATPEAHAQRRGGGARGGSGVGVYVGPGGVGVQYGRGGYYPGYGYNRGYGNYGSYGRYWSGSGYYSPYRSSWYGGYPRYYSQYDASTPMTYEVYGAESTPANARVRVQVPDPNAEVFFNNAATQQRGTERVFDTPDLRSGATYTYDIKARWRDANGQMIERTHSVNVEQGRESFVDFTQGAEEVIQQNPTRGAKVERQ